MKVVARDGVKSLEDWLEPGQYLSVLAISSTPSTGSRFLLWSKKQSGPALFPASDFEVLDQSLPPAWVAQVDLNGYVEFAPKEWLCEGFWERYYDDDPEAEQVFKNGVAAICAHD
jgi:hypothetical protein